MMNKRNFLLIILFVLISAHLYCAVNGIGYYKKSSIIENFGNHTKLKAFELSMMRLKFLSLQMENYHAFMEKHR